MRPEFINMASESLDPYRERLIELWHVALSLGAAINQGYYGPQMDAALVLVGKELPKWLSEEQILYRDREEVSRFRDAVLALAHHFGWKPKSKFSETAVTAGKGAGWTNQLVELQERLHKASIDLQQCITRGR